MQDYNVVTRDEPAGAAAGFVEFARTPRAAGVMEGMNHVRVEGSAGPGGEK